MNQSNVVQIPRKTSRQWKAAKINPLTSDWAAYTRPTDVDIRHGLQTIRARARDLAQNSDHAKGFLRIVRNNVVGAPGFVLQSRAATVRGKPDNPLRQQIEAEWREWGKRGNCEVSGKFSWRMLQRHIAETVAREGEAFIRIATPWTNRWGFALQVIDPESVDLTYNGEYQGREVRMGVEIDDWRNPVAYHIYGEPPINVSSYRTGTNRFRIPADEIIHVYLPELVWQTRGVPWLAVAAQRLHMITGTEDAEVTASRASACKQAAYEAKEWAPAPEAPVAGLVDSSGDPIASDPGAFAQEMAPGTNEIVPYGYELKLLDPQHPNANMPDFLKWGLRSVGTGLGVSYNTLGNDAEGVNYTSLRFFLGVEHDNWMESQDWFESDFPSPVFDAWTTQQLMLGTVTPRPGRELQARNVHWQPRRWDGPDPSKQAQADRQDLENGSTSLTKILARKAIDFDDLLEERVSELQRLKAKADELGVPLDVLLPYLTASVVTTGGSADESQNTGDENAEEK